MTDIWRFSVFVFCFFIPNGYHAPFNPGIWLCWPQICDYHSWYHEWFTTKKKQHYPETRDTQSLFRDLIIISVPYMIIHVMHEYNHIHTPTWIQTPNKYRSIFKDLHFVLKGKHTYVQLGLAKCEWSKLIQGSKPKNWLVVSTCPSEKIWKSLGVIYYSPSMEKYNNVPNHQPLSSMLAIYFSPWCSRPFTSDRLLQWTQKFGRWFWASAIHTRVQSWCSWISSLPTWHENIV